MAGKTRQAGRRDGTRRAARARAHSRKNLRPFLIASTAAVVLALGLALGFGIATRPETRSPEPGPPPPQAAPRPGESVGLPEAGGLPGGAEEEAATELFARGSELSKAAAGRTAGGSTSLPRLDAGTASRPRPDRQIPARRPRLIIVIDDVGYNISQLEPFLALPFPLTFAVLPGLPFSERAAAMIHAAGKELILHQPMEALGGANPGPEAIWLSTKPEEAAATVERNLDSLPGAVGLNNHEGSAVSRDPALMAAILEVAKSRGIYYLDSLTISDTATAEVAFREKIRYWERDVFLDNSPDRVSIIHYFEAGKKKAEKNGAAIMIGHVWSAELAQTLYDLYPGLIEEGFSLSTISKAMLEEADARPGD